MMKKKRVNIIVKMSAEDRRNAMHDPEYRAFVQWNREQNKKRMRVQATIDLFKAWANKNSVSV